MNRLLQKLSLAAPMAAVALTLVTSSAQAQSIQTIQGGRSILTLSTAFLADLTGAKIKPETQGGAPLTDDKIVFGVSSGAINLDNAYAQVLHTGGMEFISGKNVVTVESFILSTWGEVPNITAIVTANGKFVGRIILFDVDLQSDLKLPLAPTNGYLFLSGLSLRLDPAGAAALNDALGEKTLHENDFVGNLLSVDFVPLTADVPPAN